MPAVATNELFDLIFAAGDCVLIRPIEIWHEDGKRKAKNLYKSTDYVRLGSRNVDGWIDDETPLNAAMTRHLAEADKTRANLFFGVCPRFASKYYDEAWAIRCVHTLWADLDDITVGDALAKVNDASLAPPSAVVFTGGGVHLYWALAEPYLIDDVGDPPPAAARVSEQEAVQVHRGPLVRGRSCISPPVRISRRCRRKRCESRTLCRAWLPPLAAIRLLISLRSCGSREP